jgi:hypothetical protein
MHALPRLEKAEGGGNCFEVVQPLNPHRHHLTCDFTCCVNSYVTRGYLFSIYRCSYVFQSMSKQHSRLIVA